MIKTGWIMMYNQYTSDVFSNPRLVKNIHNEGGCYITIHCDAGKRHVTKEATLKVYGTVWFDEGAIENTLSFIRIREKYPICYDTNGKYFSILKPDKEVLLIQKKSGMYFQDTYNCDMILINTVFRAGRDSNSNNTTAPSKREVNWPWWGTLQRKSSKK